MPIWGIRDFYGHWGKILQFCFYSFNQKTPPGSDITVVALTPMSFAAHRSPFFLVLICVFRSIHFSCLSHLPLSFLYARKLIDQNQWIFKIHWKSCLFEIGKMDEQDIGVEICAIQLPCKVTPNCTKIAGLQDRSHIPLSIFIIWIIF